MRFASVLARGIVQARLVLIGLILAGLVLTGCGSSAVTNIKAADADPALAFAQCMRAHGVPDYPDPGAQRQIAIAPGSGLDPQAPAFQAAQRACQKYAPVGNLGPPHMTAAQQRAALTFAECMRANGQPNFPDPSSSIPAGAQRVLMLRGMVFTPGPGLDPASPAFRQAASRCGVKPPPGATPQSTQAPGGGQ